MSLSAEAVTRLAGRDRTSWMIFLGLAAALLAVDLVVKWLAFEHVAGPAIVLGRDADDGSTVVFARRGDTLVKLTPDRAGDPSAALPQHETITLVPYGLSLKLVLNTGAVFGMGKGSQWLFVVVSVAAIVVIGRVFWTTPARARTIQAALALILAGALGNLYDRVRFNAVRDMFWLFPEVHLPLGLSWPGGRTDLYPWIFNVADVALLVGVGLMLLVLWRGPRPAPSAERAAH